MTQKKENLSCFSINVEKMRFKTLEETEKICKVCIKCPLSENKTQVVFSGGNPKAKLMIIGEAPGKNEDETGIPFVGRAGKLLDKILLSKNITREKDVYICNTVKCRPPENRVPTPEEKQACREYLEAQIYFIQPKLILLAGSTAVKSILNTNTPISKIRGQWFDGPLGSKVMPIFHPSYLLRFEYSKNPDSPKWLMMQDIENIRNKLDKIYAEQ